MNLALQNLVLDTIFPGHSILRICGPICMCKEKAYLTITEWVSSPNQDDCDIGDDDDHDPDGSGDHDPTEPLDSSVDPRNRSVCSLKIMHLN